MVIKRNGNYTVSLFTRRQLEVLSLIAKGCSNKLISEKLTVGTKSVENYINAIYDILFPGICSEVRVNLHPRVTTANYFNLYTQRFPNLMDKLMEVEEEVRLFQYELVEDLLKGIIEPVK